MCAGKLQDRTRPQEGHTQTHATMTSNTAGISKALTDMTNAGSLGSEIDPSHRLHAPLPDRRLPHKTKLLSVSMV